MKKFVGKAMADKNAQDLLGVMRGLYRVQNEIVKRYPFIMDDFQRFERKAQKTPESLSFDFSIFSGPERQPFVEYPVDASQKPIAKNPAESENLTNGEPSKIQTQTETSDAKTNSMSDNNQVAPEVEPKKPPIIRTETSAKFYFDYEGYLKENDDKYSEAIEQKVPTTSVGRAWEWTRTGVSVLGGAAFNTAMSSVGIRSQAKQNGDGSEFLAQIATEENAERLSMALCKMRGAALKVGQALSMQEDHLIPENLRKAFDKAKQSANIMPKSQLDAALVKELGKDWKSNFETFDQRPIAAASIGQVHRATLKNGRDVILKIQYPGVSTSIDSDLDNLRRLMVWTGQFPRGLYLDDLIEASREELKEECNYLIEAEKQKKYISHFGDRPGFKIPEVIDSLSTQHILTMEFLDGVDMQTCAGFPQEIRNSIGARILESTIREIFEVKFMQTDPNPANFFYNTVTGDLNLLDFGAARGYSEEFVNEYLQTVYGASNNDAALVLRSTTALGFLTGEESKVMIEAHIESVLVVGLPFSELGEFDFGNQGMTKRIYKLMPVMMKNRLKAPPKEVYSLHRKLAGAYLLNMMLKTKIPARGIFHKVLKEINPAWLKGKVLKS